MVAPGHHPAKQDLLVAQRTQVSQAVTTICQRHRQVAYHPEVAYHPARMMQRAPLMDIIGVRRLVGGIPSAPPAGHSGLLRVRLRASQRFAVGRRAGSPYWPAIPPAPSTTVIGTSTAAVPTGLWRGSLSRRHPALSSGLSLQSAGRSAASHARRRPPPALPRRGTASSTRHRDHQRAGPSSAFDGSGRRPSVPPGKPASTRLTRQRLPKRRCLKGAIIRVAVHAACL